MYQMHIVVGMDLVVAVEVLFPAKIFLVQSEVEPIENLA